MKITIKLPEDVIARMAEGSTRAVKDCAQHCIFLAAMGSEITEGDDPNPMFAPPRVREWRDVTVDVPLKELRWILTGIVAHEIRINGDPGSPPGPLIKEADLRDEAEDIPF
jgi:hypothetical protein